MVRYILGNICKAGYVIQRERGAYPNLQLAWDVFHEDENGRLTILNPSPKTVNPWDPHFDATKVKDNADIQS